MSSAPKPDKEGAVSGSWLSPAIMLRTLLAVTFLVYARTLAFDFVYDDHYQIALNPWLDSWRRIPSFFTHQLWAFSDHMPASYYRPVFLAWFSVIKMATGGAPAWYHLFTVALHVVVVFEAFLLARLLLRNSTTALIAAALFALHPAKIEDVAWISGGGEPLYAAFFFATFIAYLNGRDRSSRGTWTALALVCFLVALFTKEQAIVLPGILAVYEFFRLRNNPFRARVVKTGIVVLPFALASALYWLVRSHAVHGLTEFAHQISIQKTLLTQPLIWTFYLRHLLFPSGLTVMYPAMVVRDFSVTRLLLPALFVLLTFALAFYFARRSAEGVLLLAWFLLTLAPPAAMVLMLQPHDRYLYLPSFAFCVVIAVLIGKFVPEGPAQAITVVAICLVLAFGTMQQMRYWDNDVALWGRAVALSPSSTPARIALAGAYAQNGDFNRALEIFHEAAESDPNNYDAWYSLGVQEYTMGRYADALPHLKKALERATQNFQKTMCLNDLGIVAAQLEQKSQAEEWLRQSIQLDPNSAVTRNALAAVLEGEGRREEARAQRLAAIRNQRSN